MVKKIKNKFKHSLGKFRRLYLSTFRKNYVNKMLAQRKGQCNQCGACCKLLLKCPFLIEEKDSFSCSIYGKVRPVNCVVFPINKKDIKDRDLILPEVPCGYFFEVKERSNQ